MVDITPVPLVAVTGRINVYSELVKAADVRASEFGHGDSREGYIRSLKFVYDGPWLAGVEPADPDRLAPIGEVERDLAEIVAMLPRYSVGGGGWLTLVQQDADLSSGAGLWRLYLRPGGGIDRISPTLVWSMRCQNPSCQGHAIDGDDPYPGSCPDW